MLSKAETKRLQALARAKTRAETHRFIAEGVRVVEELLASSVVLRNAYLATSLEDTPRGAALAARLRDTGLAVDVTNAELSAIATTDTPQGVVALAEIPELTLATLELPARCVLVVLDAVQDPGNFGTIVRSAHAFGASAVVVLPGTVDPWNPKVVRSAAGSSLHVPIVEATLAELRAYATSERLLLLGADGTGQSIDARAAAERVALVLGNEGAGLSDDVRAACDDFAAVPIRGGAESLNVGVAAGILLYSLSRNL